MLQTGQVLFQRLCVSRAVVLPFKDSKGGTWALELSDFKRNYVCRQAPVKKQKQYADRTKAFTSHQIFGPAISEAVEPRCSTLSATELPIPLAGLRHGLASILSGLYA